MPKSEAHAKDEEIQNKSQKSKSVEKKVSEDQTESVNVRMDTDTCDKMQNDVCDQKNKDENDKTETEKISQDENMDCKCEAESDSGNDKQTVEHTGLSNVSKGSHCDLRNSAKLHLGEELLDLFRSLHSGPKVQNGITTVGMVSFI